MENSGRIHSIKRFFSKYIIPICLFQKLLIAGDSDYNIVHYTVENGLASNVINDICQDKKGYMWFCTASGLDRFDGYEFRRYKYVPGDTTSLSSSWIWSALEDHSGDLWVATSNGLNLYNPHKDTFTLFNHDPDDSTSLSGNYIRCLLEDSKGNLWIGTGDNGLNKLDESRRTNRHYLPGIEIGDIFENTRTGDIWLKSQNDLFMYDSLLDRMIRPETFQKFMKSKRYSIASNILLIDDKLMIGLADNLNEGYYLAEINQPGKMVSINNYVGFLYYDENTTTIWAGGHAFYQHQNRGKINSREIRLFINGKRYLYTAKIVKIMKDNAGSLWIATRGDGILYISLLGSQFKNHPLVNTIEPVFDPEDGLPGVYATDLATDMEGNLWYSSWHGVYRLSEDRKSARRYMQRLFSTSPTFDMFYKKNNGELWLASGNKGGLYRYREKSGDFEHFSVRFDMDYKSISSDNISVLFEDKLSRFWIGHKEDGLDLFDEKKGEFINFRNEPGRDNSLSSNRISAIANADSGKLWIGTYGAGLNLFDPVNNTALRFRYSKKSQNCISDDIVESLVATDDSILWIGTRSGGLNKFNTKLLKFKYFFEKDGLPSNNIINLIADLNEDIWIATENGLARINKKSEEIQVYDNKDGITNTQFTETSSYLSPDGELFWGHYGGFISVFPDSLKKNTYIPPVVFTDFQIFNKPVKLDTSINKKKHIILNHDDKVFSFKFAALNYFAPERNQYRYKLEGFDPDWVEAGKRRFVSYTNLSAGEYTFRVLGSNNNDLWNKAGDSIHITILPPWWKTTWAYVTYGLLIFVLLFSLRRYELNRQQHKHNWQLQQLEAQKYQEIDQMKSRFFANISHEFRTPLTLLEGPIQQMLSGNFNGNIKNQYQLMLRNTRRLKQLINQLLDLSRLDSGKMELKAAAYNIIPLLKGLVYSFESLARQKNINLIFNPCDNNIEVYIDREKFEKITLNLLSNAFKFTPEEGEIIVTLIVPNTQYQMPNKSKIPNSDFVEMSISNTGPVIPPDHLDKIFDRFYQADDSLQRGQESSGIGLALTKELVELHHGTITATSCPEKNTTFTVRLPLGNTHLCPDEIISETAEQATDIKTGLIPDQIKPAIDIVEKTIPTVGDYPKLLIVEDNADMRAYMLSCLDDDYKISQAEDGEKGFYQAVKQFPDIIISDVMMPGMDGFQFCNAVKTDERTSHIPVILLTAKASGESKIEGLETGADDYLTKPFDKRELLVRIKNLIEQRRKLREKFRTNIIVLPGEITATSIDEKFLQKAVNAVEKHIADPDFDTTALSLEIGASRMLLHTKLKALTGQTTADFIRTLRLKRAAQLLELGSGNVSEIAYEVGFNNLSYFAKKFKETFGTSPSKFVNE